MAEAEENTSLWRRAAALALEMRGAARLYDTSVVRLLVDSVRLRRQTGFGPREGLADGLLDPALPRARWSRAIPKVGMVHLQNRLNPASHVVLTEDKIVFDAYCRSLGLPVPHTVAVLDGAGGWKTDGTPLRGAADWVGFLEREAPDEVVVKPAEGVYGRGVRVFSRQDHRFREASGLWLTAGELVAQLTADRRHRRLVLQRRLRNHSALEELSGTQALQTMRMVTLVSEDGEPALYYALLKLITGAAVVDNIDHGRTGNILAVADPATGVLESALAPRPPLMVAVDSHPRTGKRIAGFAVPVYREACELVLRAARLFLPLRTIGWDVASTPNGPVLVEGNAYWDPFSHVLPRTRNDESRRRWEHLVDLLQTSGRDLRPGRP